MVSCVGILTHNSGLLTFSSDEARIYGLRIIQTTDYTTFTNDKLKITVTISGQGKLMALLLFGRRRRSATKITLE